MLIFKNAHVYSPANEGIKDVMVAGGKIIALGDNLSFKGARQIDAKECYLCPGFIDSHVHITGGGGEGGFKSMVPPLQLSTFIKGGVTTALGMLGTDGSTRSIKSLVAKAKGLKEEGLSIFVLTGAYACPGPTLTGDVKDDIVFIEEIIGTKVAISDHRDAAPSIAQLAQLCANTRVSGMIANKAGIVVFHLGDAALGLRPIKEMLASYNIPLKVFRPTHVNKNAHLLEEAREFVKAGGYIDLTCGIREEFAPAKVVKTLLDEGTNTQKVTMSSDAGGSYSSYDSEGVLLKIGVAGFSLHKELKSMMKLGIKLETALTFMSINPAKALSLYPQKGCVEVGADADILLLKKESLDIQLVMAKGEIMLDGVEFKKGFYENG